MFGILSGTCPEVCFGAQQQPARGSMHGDKQSEEAWMSFQKEDRVGSQAWKPALSRLSSLVPMAGAPGKNK